MLLYCYVNGIEVGMEGICFVGRPAFSVPLRVFADAFPSATGVNSVYIYPHYYYFRLREDGRREALGVLLRN